MSGFGPLDLSDADTRGFAPLDAGRYNAEIVEVKMDATRNDGKTPKGTPMIKVHVRVLEPQIDGEVVDQDRRAFSQFVIPPKDHDPKKKATMQGMIARFFMALGYPEEQVKDKKFNPDFEDLKGLACVVTLGKEPKKDTNGEVIPDEWNNPIKGFKEAGTLVGTGGGGLL
jgi:hypothetical protein